MIYNPGNGFTCHLNIMLFDLKYCVNQESVSKAHDFYGIACCNVKQLNADKSFDHKVHVVSCLRDGRFS